MNGNDRSTLITFAMAICLVAGLASERECATAVVFRPIAPPAIEERTVTYSGRDVPAPPSPATPRPDGRSLDNVAHVLLWLAAVLFVLWIAVRHARRD